jgi:hypothetical protein
MVTTTINIATPTAAFDFPLWYPDPDSSRRDESKFMLPPLKESPWIKRM